MIKLSMTPCIVGSPSLPILMNRAGHCKEREGFEYGKDGINPSALTSGLPR